MAGLDLLGVIAIGLLGAISVTGLQSSAPGDRVIGVLKLLRIQDETFQMQALILGFGALILLVGRTALSIIFTRRILFFLSRRGAKIAADLISRLLSQDLLVIQSRTTQETVFAATRGVLIIVLQVLATAVVWIADLAVLVVMMVGLLVVDMGTAIATLLVFFLVGLFLYKFMHIHAGNLGAQNSKMEIKSNENSRNIQFISRIGGTESKRLLRERNRTFTIFGSKQVSTNGISSVSKQIRYGVNRVRRGSPNRGYTIYAS